METTHSSTIYGFTLRRSPGVYHSHHRSMDTLPSGTSCKSVFNIGLVGMGGRGMGRAGMFGMLGIFDICGVVGSNINLLIVHMPPGVHGPELSVSCLPPAFAVCDESFPFAGRSLTGN